jgi:hypothetical protein
MSNAFFVGFNQGGYFRAVAVLPGEEEETTIILCIS